MPLKCQKYGIGPISSTCIYGERMPIYKPHMKLFTLMMSEELLYTDDDDAGH